MQFQSSALSAWTSASWFRTDSWGLYSILIKAKLPWMRPTKKNKIRHDPWNLDLAIWGAQRISDIPRKRSGCPGELEGEGENRSPNSRKDKESKSQDKSVGRAGLMAGDQCVEWGRHILYRSWYSWGPHIFGLSSPCFALSHLCTGKRFLHLQAERTTAALKK